MKLIGIISVLFILLFLAVIYIFLLHKDVNHKAQQLTALYRDGLDKSAIISRITSNNKKLEDSLFSTSYSTIEGIPATYTCYEKDKVPQNLASIKNYLSQKNRVLELLCSWNDLSHFIISSQIVATDINNHPDSLSVSRYTYSNEVWHEGQNLYTSNGDAKPQYNHRFELLKWLKNGSVLYAVITEYPFLEAWIYYQPFNTDRPEVREWCDLNEFISGKYHVINGCKDLTLKNTSQYLPTK